MILISATELTFLSIAALTGALLTAWFGLQYGVFTYEEALGFIDVKLLALIIGVMVVVEIAERSGLFRLVALTAVKYSGGNPTKLFILFCVVSATVSMFLSDPMAMLMMAAATISITKLLKYDPTPYFLSAVIMINLGGTSTLIGSISNMIIGVESGLTFIDFVNYLAVGEVLLWFVTILALYLFFKPRLGIQKTLPEINPWDSITDKALFRRSAFVLFLFIALFLTLEQVGIGPEGVAIGCAVLALFLSKLDPAEIFKSLDWETIFFIAGFMFLVAGVEKTQILNELSIQLFSMSGGNPINASLITLWISGLGSTIISNIAIALTFTPVISMQAFTGMQSAGIWSGLILGTNLGGAATPFSGTVVMMAIGALKREHITLKFVDFAKIGLLTTFLQLGVSSLYLVLRFGV